jgi:hypothetical protein
VAVPDVTGVQFLPVHQLAFPLRAQVRVLEIQLAARLPHRLLEVLRALAEERLVVFVRVPYWVVYHKTISF